MSRLGTSSNRTLSELPCQKQIAKPALNRAVQPKPSRRTSRAKWWMSELISLAVVLAAVTAARSSLADHYYVPSGSMQYTLMDHDRVIVNKMAYGFRIPLTKIDIFGSSTPDARRDRRVRLARGRHDAAHQAHRRDRRRPRLGRRRPIVDQRPAARRSTGRALRRARGVAESHVSGRLQPRRRSELRSACRRGWCSRWATTAATATTAASSGFIDEQELFGRAVAIYYRRGECGRFEIPCMVKASPGCRCERRRRPWVGASQASVERARWWISELISLALVIAAVTGARSSLADHYRVESGSMEYSLMTYDRVDRQQDVVWLPHSAHDDRPLRLIDAGRAATSPCSIRPRMARRGSSSASSPSAATVSRSSMDSCRSMGSRSAIATSSTSAIARRCSNLTTRRLQPRRRTGLRRHRAARHGARDG